MRFLNFFRLIHIHPILIIFIFISLITGTFVHLFILFAIVIIHEIGHFLAASYYKWRIHSIVLWVFGGVMKTEEAGNRPIKEDIIVTVAGPLQHGIIFLFIFSLASLDMIPLSIIQTAYQYNTILFLFNLLPIYPLDGGKLLFLILSYFIPFKQAHRFTIYFSIITCSSIVLLQLFILPFTLSSLLIIVFLLIENRTEWKNHYYIFMRFLLHRLAVENVNFPTKTLFVPSHYLLMEVFTLFRRNNIHLILINNDDDIILTEKKSLTLYFKEKRYTETVGEIVKKLQ